MAAPRDPQVEAILRELGERIRKTRVAANLSQETAAAAAEIDYKRWQRLEQGEVNPTVNTLFRVSQALGTTFWELVATRSPADPSQIH